MAKRTVEYAAFIRQERIQFGPGIAGNVEHKRHILDCEKSEWVQIQETVNEELREIDDRLELLADVARDWSTDEAD